MCPVSERDGSYAYGSAYPGPMGAVLSSQLTGVEGNAALPYAPSLCKACYDACQAKMAIPSLLVHLRSGHVEQRRRTGCPSADAITRVAVAWLLTGASYLAAPQAAGKAGR
jgi:L-lactate dehydrogenase complex protein LldF